MQPLSMCQEPTLSCNLIIHESLMRMYVLVLFFFFQISHLNLKPGADSLPLVVINQLYVIYERSETTEDGDS